MLAALGRGTIMHNVQIPKTGGGFWPHLVDVYIPATNNLQVTVCLHGGSGDKVSHAQQMGVLNASTSTVKNTNWPLLEFWQSIAAFPQGQGSPVATWSNGFMNSGVDDVAFLQDFKLWAVAQWGLPVNMAGHSNGGFMALRMWYESPTTFAHFIAFNGPADNSYSASAVPATRRPLLRITGRLDTTTGVRDWQTGADHLYDAVWNQNPANQVPQDTSYPALGHYEGSWHQMVKASADAGVTLNISDGVTTAASSGTVTTWSVDAGKQQLRVYSAAGHSLADIHTATGERPFFAVCQWLHNV